MTERQKERMTIKPLTINQQIFHNLNHLIEDFHNFRAQMRIRLDNNRERITQLTIKTDALTAVAQKLSADAETNANEIKQAIAKLGGVTSDEPAVQKAIDDAVAILEGVSTRVEAGSTELDNAVGN